MKYLLDTDHISIIQLRSGSEYVALAPRVAQRQSDLAFNVISFHEQMLGAHTFIGRARSSNDVVRGYRLIEQIIAVFSTAPILSFDAASAQVFDALRALRIRVPTMIYGSLRLHCREAWWSLPGMPATSPGSRVLSRKTGRCRRKVRRGQAVRARPIKHFACPLRPSGRFGGAKWRGGHDLTALDRLMRHPVYGKMSWVCVLNPGAETFKTVQVLLAATYDMAVRKRAKAKPSDMF